MVNQKKPSEMSKKSPRFCAAFIRQLVGSPLVEFENSLEKNIAFFSF